MIDFSELLTLKEQRDFWSRVDKQPNGCWEWTGANNGSQRRAIFWRKGERYVAARVAWSLHHGTAVPEGMFVCHHCDNPNCLQVLSHLFLGTQTDNMRDAARKGRTCRGSDRPETRLNEDVVHFARLVYHKGLMRVGEIATFLEISHPTASLMLRGKTWQHAPMPEEVTE